MIQVTLFRQDGYVGFSIKGHSGYAEHGSDIVCAAVSAIAQSAVMGLEDIAKVETHHVQSGGTLECSFPKQYGELQKTQCETIMGTMLLGIKSIAAQYPKHVKISEMEV